MALGHLKDSPSIAMRAATYLMETSHNDR
jgi:hypothetical protein